MVLHYTYTQRVKSTESKVHFFVFHHISTIFNCHFHQLLLSVNSCHVMKSGSFKDLFENMVWLCNIFSIYIRVSRRKAENQIISSARFHRRVLPWLKMWFLSEKHIMSCCSFFIWSLLQFCLGLDVYTWQVFSWVFRQLDLMNFPVLVITFQMFNFFSVRINK